MNLTLFDDIDIPTVVNMAFLQHLQGGVCCPDDVNVPHWYWEVHSWFNVMTINVIPFDRPEFVGGFIVNRHLRLTVETRPTLLADHLCALRLSRINPVLRWILGLHDLFQTIWLFHLRSAKTWPNFVERHHWARRLSRVGPASKWISRFHGILPTNALFQLRSGTWTFNHLSALLFPLHWVYEHGFSRVQNFQLLHTWDQKNHFQIPPAYNAYPKNIPSKNFLTKLMDSRLVFRRNRVVFNTWTKWNIRSFKRFFKSPFIRWFPVR